MFSFKLSDEQVNLLKKINTAIKYVNFKNETEFTIKETDILDFQIELDDAIISIGMKNQDTLTLLGCKLQNLYDEIYYQKQNQINSIKALT